jgi:hypothetical protein
MRIHLTLAGVLAAAALLAAPAHAQPFNSDVTGPIITGSGVAGMGYPIIPFRDIENALFRQVNGRTAFRTRAIADAMLSAAAEAQRAACSGTLQPPADWPDSIALPLDAQRAVCGLLTGNASREERDRVVRLLTGGVEGPHVALAQRLVELLSGLASMEMTFVDDRQRFVAAGNWKEALRVYTDYLAAAPDSVMEDPPGELVVIAAILDAVVDAGLHASAR